MLFIILFIYLMRCDVMWFDLILRLNARNNLLLSVTAIINIIFMRSLISLESDSNKRCFHVLRWKERFDNKTSTIWTPFKYAAAFCSFSITTHSISMNEDIDKLTQTYRQWFNCCIRLNYLWHSILSLPNKQTPDTESMARSNQWTVNWYHFCPID